MTEPLLTVAEAAAILRVTPKTIRRYLKHGRLPGTVRLSDQRTVRIPQAAIKALLTQK